MTAVAASTGSASAPGRSRAYLAIGIVAAIVVAIVLLSLIAPSHRTDGPELDTSSTSAHGTKAAVELARRLGARVDVTSELPGPDTDVALMFEDLISSDQAPAVLAWVSAGHTLVIADPNSALVPAARFDHGAGFADSQSVDRGSCDVVAPAGLRELRDLESFGPLARFEVPEGASSCFADAKGAVVVVDPMGSGRVISVGTPWVFTNEALDQADNAGLFAALAVPESGVRLDVLVAGADGSGLQPPADSGNLTLPTGVALGLLQLLVAFVVYCLYRARRLGKPVPEDPPVVIAGSELTRAVGGLLEHAGARDRAASSLRRSARRRLASSFGLPVGVDPHAVVATVADRTPIERDLLEVALLDAPVADDAALAALARDLDDLVALALGPSTGPRPPVPPSPPSPSSAPPGAPS
jgi:hypothetical protein